MIASAYLAAEALGKLVDGGRLLVRLEGSCSTAQLFSAHRNCAFTIRKQPCYWASLFTAAEATEQGCYLMAPDYSGHSRPLV